LLKHNAGIMLLLICVLLISGVYLTGCPLEASKDTENRVVFAADHEFIIEQDGLTAFEETYDISFNEEHEMAVGLTHEALRQEDVDVAKGFLTDGKIIELSLVALEDDKNFFFEQYPVPVVREEILQQYPEIEEIMGEVAEKLDTCTMRRFNYLVDINEKDPGEVVKEWLLEEELIPEDPPDPPVKGGTVIVGSKEFPEQVILGELTLAALEGNGITVKDKTALGRTEFIRNALKEGEVHLYWENTREAWEMIQGEEEISGEEVYEEISRKDAEKGIIWLEYTAFENSEAIMMREEQAEELGITTVSEMADWVDRVQEGE